MKDREGEALRLELIEALSRASQLLRSHNEDEWSHNLDVARQLIVDRNFRGVEQVFGSFGGMGSFNDVVIHPVNGHLIDESEVPAANDRLDALRGRLWKLASDLRRWEILR